MRKVALDLAARKISYCEVESGKVLVRRTASSLSLLRDLLGPDRPPARVAIEACREAWHVHAVLTKWGNEVLLVDTTRVRQLGIGQHGRKTDRIDAEVLALAVERGAIPEAHVLSPARQQLRLELSVRRALVETRAQYITTVRGLVRAQGGSLPTCKASYFLEHLQRAELHAQTRALVAPLAAVLAPLDAQIVAVERRITELAESEPVIKQLTTVPFVGLIVAAAFVSVIDDAHRFERADQVGAYLGLVPNEKSTGDRRRLGAITKQGNTYMRALLVQSAWRIMARGGGDDPLARWARAVAKRRGNRIAVVALARRLAGVLWAMWRENTVYDPAWVGKRSASGLKREAQRLEYRAAALEGAAARARVRERQWNRAPKAAKAAKGVVQQ